MDITAPKHSPEHPDRDFDCELALKPTFQAAVAEAVAAGWQEVEVAEAMLELARSHIASILADQGSDLDIEAAARSVM